MSRRFGLKFDAKIDVIAAIALALSLASVGWQIWSWSVGAHVVLLPTESALLVAGSSVNPKDLSPGLDCPKKVGRYPGDWLLIVTKMAYVNDGEAGYNATINSERVLFKFAQNQREYRWDAFVNWDRDDNYKLCMSKVSEALPFPVNGQSSAGHSTLFAPVASVCEKQQPECEYRNRAGWAEFIQELTVGKKVEFRFSGDVYDRKPKERICARTVTADQVKFLTEHGWLSFPCDSAQ